MERLVKARKAELAGRDRQARETEEQRQRDKAEVIRRAAEHHERMRSLLSEHLPPFVKALSTELQQELVEWVLQLFERR